MSGLSDIRRVGLLAAWGDYPFLVAGALKRAGVHVSCLGVRDHADPELAKVCDDFRWVGFGRLGQGIRYFRKQGVREATMAGKFHKVILYKPWLLLRHLPDWTAIKTFYPHWVTGKQDRKDDTLLGTLVDAFGDAGIEFHPATDFAPELLVPQGPITDREPNPTEARDIEFGWRLAKEMGRLDVGQSVCVKDQAVIAVEAIEGTDACIRRAGELCKKGAFYGRQSRETAARHAVRRADCWRRNARNDGRRRGADSGGRGRSHDSSRRGRVSLVRAAA